VDLEEEPPTADVAPAEAAGEAITTTTTVTTTTITTTTVVDPTAIQADAAVLMEEVAAEVEFKPEGEAAVAVEEEALSTLTIKAGLHPITPHLRCRMGASRRFFPGPPPSSSN